MCVGDLFKPPSPPPVPEPRLDIPPPIKEAEAPSETPQAEQLREDAQETVDTRKKKALEIQKVQTGVREFGAINPATPESPEGGITNPGL